MPKSNKQSKSTDNNSRSSSYVSKSKKSSSQSGRKSRSTSYHNEKQMKGETKQSSSRGGSTSRQHGSKHISSRGISHLLESPKRTNSSSSVIKSASPKTKKSKSPSQKYEKASPASTVTTVSTISTSSSSSPESKKSTDSKRRRDKKTSNEMKRLSMTDVDSDDVNLFNCDWTNGNHLEILIVQKQPSIKESTKNDFRRLNLQKQLMEVFDLYTPTELKMVYSQIGTKLGMKISSNYFKSLKKGKEALIKVIWNNRKHLRNPFDE